jgi:DnaK suppressor protein
MNELTEAMGAHAQLRQDLEVRRCLIVDELKRCLSRIRQAEMRLPDAETWEEDTRDIDASLIDMLNATVRRIDAALERLAAGNYGFCARCRRRIGEARLRAMPFAVRCQACETTRERDMAARRQHGRRTFLYEGAE